MASFITTSAAETSTVSKIDTIYSNMPTADLKNLNTDLQIATSLAGTVAAFDPIPAGVAISAGLAAITLSPAWR